LPTTADSRRAAGAGHQATQTTGPPSAQVRRQRPVRASHSRSVPSLLPDASHWPLGSTANDRTCAGSSGAVDPLRNLCSRAGAQDLPVRKAQAR